MQLRRCVYWITLQYTYSCDKVHLFLHWFNPFIQSIPPVNGLENSRLIWHASSSWIFKQSTFVRSFLLLQNHFVVLLIDRLCIFFNHSIKIECCVNEFYLFYLVGAYLFIPVSLQIRYQDPSTFFLYREQTSICPLIKAWIAFQFACSRSALIALGLIKTLHERAITNRSGHVELMLFCQTLQLCQFFWKFFTKQNYQKGNKPLKIMSYNNKTYCDSAKQTNWKVERKKYVKWWQERMTPPSEMIKWIYSKPIKIVEKMKLLLSNLSDNVNANHIRTFLLYYLCCLQTMKIQISSQR